MSDYTVKARVEYLGMQRDALGASLRTLYRQAARDPETTCVLEFFGANSCGGILGTPFCSLEVSVRELPAGRRETEACLLTALKGLEAEASKCAPFEACRYRLLND